jgi:hypothetical protein
MSKCCGGMKCTCYTPPYCPPCQCDGCDFCSMKPGRRQQWLEWKEAHPQGSAPSGSSCLVLIIGAVIVAVIIGAVIKSHGSS